MCQQLSQRQGITVGRFPACPVQSGAEHRVRANMLRFRLRNCMLSATTAEKNGQSLPRKVKLTLELNWWLSVNLWA